MAVYVQVWGNGCTRNLLAQHWVYLRDLAEEGLSNKQTKFWGKMKLNEMRRRTVLKKKKNLAVGEARKAMYSDPLQALKERTLDSPVFAAVET